MLANREPVTAFLEAEVSNITAEHLKMILTESENGFMHKLANIASRFLKIVSSGGMSMPHVAECLEKISGVVCQIFQQLCDAGTESILVCNKNLIGDELVDLESTAWAFLTGTFLEMLTAFTEGKEFFSCVEVCRLGSEVPAVVHRLEAHRVYVPLVWARGH